MTKRKISQNSSPVSVQDFVFVGIFAVLNLLLFLGLGTSDRPLKCSPDTILQVATLYLANAGLKPFNAALPDSCSRPNGEPEKELISAVSQIIKECRNQRLNTRDFGFQRPLVTLFTTHATHTHDDAEKNIVHNNTLANWASFKPFVNLILFSNESDVLSTSVKYGWDAISLSNTSRFRNPPVLREMFLTAMEKYDTPWYGYINADILFTSDLIKTLRFISSTFPLNTSRVLITGRRTNVNNVTLVNISSDDAIRHTAASFGSLFREDAEDYFITTKSFPWSTVLPVVVGRPGYDNWLVAEAWCRLETAVIDVTDTNVMLHQTTQKGGNSEGHTHDSNNYNFELFKRNNITPNYMAGLTSCTPFRTFSSFCDTILIEKKVTRGENCKCTRKP